MILLQLDGVSATKVLLTLLLWTSSGISIYVYFKYYRILKKTFSKSFFILFSSILIWNTLCIVKSVYTNDGSLTTLFGNVYTGLALLVPFFMVFSSDVLNLYRMHIVYIRMITIGVILFILFFIAGQGSFDIIQNRILYLLFIPVIFLLPLVFKLNTKIKYLIWIGLLMIVFNVVLMSNRTMVVRVLLLLGCGIILFLYLKNYNKLLLRVSFLILIVPFFLLNQSIETGSSAIQAYMSDLQDKKLKTDTRTFLYIEVFDDLIKNKKLIFGKGANGKYYSRYFKYAEGDNENRLTVEVGVLFFLLKGGLIAVILNLVIVMMAIYYAFFRSDNYYVVALGFVLLVHAILLFIENIPIYSLYNIIIWFYIGLCGSKYFRSLSDYQINQLLNLKTK